MTELTGTFDESNHPDWSKLFPDSPKSIHDIDVIGLCDKTTGEKHEFVSLDRVLEIIDQAKIENNETNDDPIRGVFEIEYNDFRDRVLALKGGEQG